MSASQGEKIIRFQHLYKTYSRLAFTRPTDRPIAIDGIQTRLIKAFGVHGGFGVFDEHDRNDLRPNLPGLLRRSLLWYRPAGSNLAFVEFPEAIKVPSWSWLAYIGAIDYFKPGFGEIAWVDLRSPWSRGGAQPATTNDEWKNRPSLAADMSVLVDGFQDQKEGMVSYDIPTKSLGEEKNSFQCVVLGIEKGDTAIESRMHYFILVKPFNSPSRTDGMDKVYYVRAGAGYLPGRWIVGHQGLIHVY